MNRRRVLAGAAVTATGVFLAASLGGARAGEGRGVKEGGTFRVVTAAGFFTIDPALAGNGPAQGPVLRPACAGLPRLSGQVPAGGASARSPISPRRSRSSRRTVRPTHFGSARTRASRTAHPSPRETSCGAFERIFDPSMNSSQGAFFDIIVGATEMLDGKTKTLAGVSAAGRTLTVKLTRRVADFPMLVAGGLSRGSGEPQGEPRTARRRPVAESARHYVSEHAPGERVVLERNKYYRRTAPAPRRPLHSRNRRRPGDHLRPGSQRRYGLCARAATVPSPRSRRTLGDAYGVNKSQFFVVPAPGVRSFMLNTSRPLFKRDVQAAAGDQLRDRPQSAGRVTRGIRRHRRAISSCHPTMPGYRDARIYPLDRSRPAEGAGTRVRAEAVRTGRPVHTCPTRWTLRRRRSLRRNLAAIGIGLEVKQFPLQVLFDKLSTPGEPFDIGRVSSGRLFDAGFLAFSSSTAAASANRVRVTGRISTPQSSTGCSTEAPRASRSAPARSRAFGEIDVQISRDAAPAIAFGVPNVLTLVSRRVGCVVVDPDLDLTAVCLK